MAKTMKRPCYFKLEWMSKFRVGVMLYVFLWDWVEGLAMLCINTELIIKMIRGVPVQTNANQEKAR